MEEAIQSISGKLMSDLRNAPNSLHNVEQINLIEWLFLHELRFGTGDGVFCLAEGRAREGTAAHHKTDNGIVREREC